MQYQRSPDKAFQQNDKGELKQGTPERGRGVRFEYSFVAGGQGLHKNGIHTADYVFDLQMPPAVQDLFKVVHGPGKHSPQASGKAEGRSNRKEREQHKARVKVKREIRAAKKEFRDNDKPTLMKVAQQTFNKYIRLRDKDKPCITCGHTGNRQRHASHYRPVGRNAKHRFNEMNVHSACSICNTHLSGNLVPYREYLISEYGEKVVTDLESDNEAHSYTVDELKEIINTYKQKIKDIA